VNWFLKIHDWLSHHRVVAVLALALLLGACVLLASRLRYEEDIAKFLPSNEQNREYAEAYQAIAGQDKIAVIFSPADTSCVPDADSIVQAMQDFETLAAEMDTRGLMKDMQMRVDEGTAFDLAAFVSENMPYFLVEEDYKRIDSLLADPDFVAKRLDEVKQQLMLPTASMTAQFLPNDPLQLFTPVLSAMQGFNMGTGFEVADGTIFTADGKHALGFFTSRSSGSETADNDLLAQLTDSVIARTQALNPSVRVSAVGGPLIAVTNARQIKHDSLLAMAIALTLILLLLAFHYRRCSDILWIVVSLIVGCVVAIGGMAIFKSEVSIIVLGIGSVIIGIAVNYPLHFLDHLREEPDRRQALKEMVSPLLIGNITTVSAFLCLVWLDAQAMRDLGVFGSLMLIGTIMFVLVFLPLWVKAPKSVRREELGVRSSNRVGITPKSSFLTPNSKFIWVVVVLTIIFGWASLKTSFDDDIRHINYMTDSQRADMQLLSAATATANAQIYVVAQADNLDAALDINDSINQILNSPAEGKILKNPRPQESSKEGILKNPMHPLNLRVRERIEVKGCGRFLPSRAEQQKRLQRWQQFWQAHAPALTAQLQTQASRQGFTADAFTPFVQMIAATPQPQDASFFQPITDALQPTFISTSYIVNYLTLPEGADEEAFKSQLRRQLPADALAFSARDISNQLVSVLNDSFNYIGFVCSFVVFFFLWLSFARIELSLVSFLPLAVGWIWILGIMHLCGLQFNIVNIILATFIFGQGDDYTIFITEGLIYEYAYGKKRLSSYKRSVILSAIIMFVGIGALIISKHPALRSLALVTIVGMGTVVLMAYYLPPLVFRWLTTTSSQNLAQNSQNLQNNKNNVCGESAEVCGSLREDKSPGGATPNSSLLTPNSFGAVREVPITLPRIARSLFALLFFLCMTTFVLKPWAWWLFTFKGDNEQTRLRLHTKLHKIARWCIYRVPGVKCTLENTSGEDFSRNAIVICNHRSHLDLFALMMLTPKIVFFTNNWVWNNPFYGSIIRRAEYIPAMDGMETNMEHIRDLWQRGYSIAIFPEGSRQEEDHIARFHQGAFLLAQQLNADILPVVLHGFAHVLPKKDFMLRPGHLHVSIHPRITNYSAFSARDKKILPNPTWQSGLNKNILPNPMNPREQAKAMRQWYMQTYRRLALRLRDAQYCATFVRYQYIYKGAGIERRCNRNLRQNNNYAAIVDNPQYTSLKSLLVQHAGQGEMPFIFALAHPDCQVFAQCDDPDDRNLLKAMANAPDNLHVLDTDATPPPCDLVITLES